MKWIVVVSCILLNVSQAYSQKYGTTLGLRFGNDRYRTAGISLEQRLLKHTTFEGIIQSDFSRNTTVHGLLKNHVPVLTKRLSLFGGAGISTGIEESIRKEESTQEVITTYGNRTLGADLIVGAELTILGVNVSVDYKPNINLAGRENWYQGQVGISVRKVLIKDSQRKKRLRKKAREKRREDRQERRQNKDKKLLWL